MTVEVPASSPVAAASSSAIPFKPAAQADASTLGGPWLATVLLLAIIASIAVLLKRRLMGFAGALPKSRLLTVVESVRLSERTRLSVVVYRGRELLIAHGDQSVTMLLDAATAAVPEEAADAS